MAAKLLSTDDFRGAVRSGGTAPDGAVYRFATGDSQDVAGATRTRRFTFSDNSVDHAGDVISQDGWDLSVFSKNPVILFAHDGSQPPIGRARNVSVQYGKLAGDVEFADEATYPFGAQIYRLVAGGYLRACSVGFKPTKWAFSNDKNRPNGINFLQQMLLEVSICPIPANPNALAEARSKGIDTRGLVTWAERLLDTNAASPVPRRQLESLRNQAGDRAARIAHAASLRRSLAPLTREGRLQEVARLKRELAARDERLREVGEIRSSIALPPETRAERIERILRTHRGAI